MNTGRRAALFLSALAVICAAAALAAGVAHAAGLGQTVVELRQESTSEGTVPDEFSSQPIGNTDSSTRKEYKFQRQRKGRNFTYEVANLVPMRSYRVELSFVEHDFSSAGKRVFNVYMQSVKVLNRLDVFSRAGGKNRAYQQTYVARADTRGRLQVKFRSDESGCKDFATVSTLRVYSSSTTTTTVEINAADSRNRMSMPVRRTDSGGQSTYEAVLGRLGSRFSLNLVSQRLAARFSSLGTGTGDLADLVLAMDDGTNVRCLPFTDRYPVWESISQAQTMTSQAFTCSSGSTPFKVTARFRSPFYPQAEKLSTAPFMYVQVTVKNAGSSPASGQLVFAMPRKLDFAESGTAEFTTASAAGISWTDRYSYSDESLTRFKPVAAREALAVDAAGAADVDFRGSDEAGFTDFASDDLWGVASPSGYPVTYSDPSSPLFTFFPRGYVGAVWSITDLGPGASASRSFVLAGYVPGKILNVSNAGYRDDGFRFRYRTHFTGVEDVVEYAASSRTAGDRIHEKSTFFDNTIGSNSSLYMSPTYMPQLRDLVALSFQNFLANTWWARSDAGRDWFSVWEGTDCRFHGTVDVEYNQAWFYYHFWPELLKQTMDQWVLYPVTVKEGTFLSHDMGWGDSATGQAYPHDMAVEENANYVLMLYKYWKTTGDTAYVKKRFSTVRTLVDFMINCDTNANGLPDLYTWNTLDQSSPALQMSRDQTYLGVKCMAAYQAAREMAGAAGDGAYGQKCRARVELVNQTLERDLWLSDHFAVCLDGSMSAADREAYSIYASNGLLYLLSGTREYGVTSSNVERFGADLKNVVPHTLREYGCTHSSFDSDNQWVSQNLWRDQAALRLGVPLNGANPLAMTDRYWKLEQFFAREMNGGFWDVLIYPGGGGVAGPSAAMSGGPVIHDPHGEGARGVPGSSSRGVAGGASGYGQSLGYYPRGAASLGLIDAAAGLVLDAPANALYYMAAARPLRVPVFSRADWANPDPSKRVPTLFFSSSGGAPAITNRHLLPSKVAGQAMLDIGGVQGAKHAISPNGDGVNDEATVEYELPTSSWVECSVWDGSERVRTFARAGSVPGSKDLTWDGRTDSGGVVPDGIYAGRIDTTAYDSKYQVRPASSDFWVNSSIPDLSTDWYLAEGFTGRNATGGEFEQYVLIQNPGAAEAAVEVTFMLPGGGTERRSYTVAPASRFTITVDDILPDAELSTHVSADRPVAVERAMYFNGRRAGHASIGVTQPSETWYLAEGYTAQSFDEYVLIQNPGDRQAEITATFMTPNMGNVTKEYAVGPHSRFTIHVDDILPAHEVSTEIESSEPVVVERAQYLNNMTSGTCSIAASSVSRTWYLAEGYTDQGFEEWVLIQNPGDEPNEVTVTYMEKSGVNTVQNYSLPPACRFTIGVDEILPKAEVSVKVRAEHPVLVERAMYWNNRSDGHAFIGTPTPDTEWYLAEGYTAQGFETWILVQNPGDTVRNVTFTFMERSGRNTVKSYTVSPRSRFTVGVNEILPDVEVSTRVSADGPVIVERAMYFNNRSGGTVSLGIRGTD